MSLGKKITELVLPITVIGGFIGAVQDIISPISKFGIWAGISFASLAVILICIPEDSKLGMLIKKISQHWKTPLIFSFIILTAITFLCANITSKSIANGGNGVLSDKIQIFAEIQNEILSLARETNVIVKDTNKTVKDTNSVVKTTQQTVNKTNDDVQTILENTRMTATKKLAELSYRVGDQSDFFRAVQELSGQELHDVLSLFKDAQLKLSRQTNVWPDLFTYDNERNALLLRMPKLTNLVHALIYLDYPIEKILAVLNVFEGSEYLKSPVADFYAEQSINPTLANVRTNVTHPQRLTGSNHSDVNFSLISYPRKRDGKETKQRGGYTLMHTAAAMGNLRLIEVLINRGHNSDEISISGYTPLALAIENEHIEVAKFILSNEVDVSKNNFIAFEVTLLKMFDGYYPDKGSPISAMLEEHKYALGEPQDNPYFKLAKMIQSKSSSTPKSIIYAVKDVYKTNVNLVHKDAAEFEYAKYPDAIKYKEYIARVQLGERYISTLSSLL